MRNNRIINLYHATALMLICLLVVPLTTGCQQSVHSGEDTTQSQMTDRLSQIAKESGGDWSKVSATDKEYLVKEVSHGDEKSAQMLLQAKSGRVQHRERPTGPPRAGGIR